MSRNKTRTVLSSLSNEERDRQGLETERLIKNEMSYIVNHYIYRYQHAAANTLGWDKDDLLQYIRMVLYTGVVTFSIEKKVKMTSYLSSILYYQMGNLSIKIQNKKNTNSKLVMVETIYESEDMIDYTSSEDWLVYARKFENIVSKLSNTEQKLLVYHLVYGHSMRELEEKIGAPKIEIVKALKTLKHKIEDLR
jgi:DNA-directed RNA polymerase specialized sigma24 family protein